MPFNLIISMALWPIKMLAGHVKNLKKINKKDKSEKLLARK